MAESNAALHGTFEEEALKSHQRAILLAFFRICSLAFLFSSFLASITLLETKFIRSAILDFLDCTLTTSISTKAQPHRKGSWLVIEKKWRDAELTKGKTEKLYKFSKTFLLSRRLKIGVSALKLKIYSKE